MMGPTNGDRSTLDPRIFDLVVPSLTPPQQAALDALSKAFSAPKDESILLGGPLSKTHVGVCWWGE